MTDQFNNNPKRDLEERSYKFARDVQSFVNDMPKTLLTFNSLKQIVKSSSSVGANYIEAQDSHTKNDFSYRVSICTKEIKETIYWLRLLDVSLENKLEEKRIGLLKEANELASIFTSITKNSKIKS